MSFFAEDEFNHCGVLRIDLQSKYEKAEFVDDILGIANQHFYHDFNVETILTKAVPSASERIAVLLDKGYAPPGRKFMIYDDYFINKLEHGK